MADPTLSAHRTWLTAQLKEAMATAKKKTATDTTHNNAIKRARSLRSKLDALKNRAGTKRKGKKRKGKKRSRR